MPLYIYQSPSSLKLDQKQFDISLGEEKNERRGKTKKGEQGQGSTRKGIEIKLGDPCHF